VHTGAANHFSNYSYSAEETKQNLGPDRNETRLSALFAISVEHYALGDIIACGRPKFHPVLQSTARTAFRQL